MFHVYTDDEKPPPASSTASVPAAPAKPSAHTPFLDGFQELNTYRWCFPSFRKCSDSDQCLEGAFSQKWILFFSSPVYSSSNEVVTLLKDYLFNALPLDIENVHKGAVTLHHLRCTLGAACQGLHGSGFHAFSLNNELKVNLEWAERLCWCSLKCVSILLKLMY